MQIQKIKRSFTLVELLIVIAILAILAAIVIFALNPARLFDNFRDSKRITDMVTLNKAINFLESWNTTNLTYGTSTFIYLSLPDSSSTCSSYTLPTLATGYSYYCAPNSTYKNTDGTGWIPINFEINTGNKYLSVLPIDPINDSTYFYSYFPGGSYELIARLKNTKLQSTNDDGLYDDAFEIGSPNRTFVTPLPKNMLVNGAMESLNNWYGFSSIETADKYEGNFSLKRTGSFTGYSTPYIKIDPTKRYRLSGCFKSIGAGGLSKVYFGHDPQDKNRQQITASMSDHWTNRETTLAQPLNPGDTTVYLTSVANYTLSGSWLGIYPFENYPDYTYTRNIYAYNVINPVNNSLTLSQAYSGTALPIGTKVAQNKSTYGSYMYSVLSNQSIPTAWTCYSSEIFGQMVPMTSVRQFRYGTQYIKIILTLNSSQDSTYSVLVDNIKLELISNQ